MVRATLLAALALAGAAVFLLWPEPAPDRRILFIGNSFTFGGELPHQVKLLAASADPAVNYLVTAHTRGGTTLSEHISETGAVETLQSAEWDVVILQDASAMPFRAEWSAQLTEAGTQLATLAQAQGAEVIFFAHWAPGDHADRKPWSVSVIETTYSQLADQTGADVAFVGQVWLAAEDAGITGLYDQDGHHSTGKGAFASALAILAALGDVDPRSTTWAPTGMDANEEEQLRQIAGTLLGAD